MPLMWEESSLRAVRCGLLPGVVLPVYVRADREFGRALFWEQRCWLEALQVRDKVGFRRLEQRRGTWQRLEEDYRLEPWDLSRPGGDTLAIGTVVMSTRGLVGWLLLKRSQADTPVHSQLCLRYVRCLDGVREAVDAGAAALGGADMPNLSIQGVPLPIAANSTVDLFPLVAAWRTLPGEWAELRDRGPANALPPFPPDGRATLTHFLIFVDLRIRATPAGQVAPWLQAVRHGLLDVVAFFVEVDTCRVFEEDAAVEHRLQPTPMLGKHRLRSVHRAVLPRFKLVRRLMETHGSSEAVARAITEGVHGVAAQQKAVRNAVYTDLARQGCRGGRRFAVGWDGSTHSGKDVSMGIAMNIDTTFMAYMKPVALTLDTRKKARQGALGMRNEPKSGPPGPKTKHNSGRLGSKKKPPRIKKKSA